MEETSVRTEKSNQRASIEFMLDKQWWPQVWGGALKIIVEWFCGRPREILRSSPLGGSSFPLLSAASTIPSEAGQFRKEGHTRLMNEYIVTDGVMNPFLLVLYKTKL